MGQPRIAPRFDGADDSRWDGVVIGAGPAGAMAARELALQGGRILLVERKRFPRWKICGACLNAHALACLRSAGLGSLVERQGAIKLDQLQVGFRNRQARLALPEGAALSRSRLDAALVDAATDAGARFMPETQANVGGIRNRLRLVRLIHRGISIETAARVVLVAAGLGNHCHTEALTPKSRPRSGRARGSARVA